MPEYEYSIDISITVKVKADNAREGRMQVVNNWEEMLQEADGLDPCISDGRLVKDGEEDEE